MTFWVLGSVAQVSLVGKPPLAKTRVSLVTGVLAVTLGPPGICQSCFPVSGW